MSAIPVGLSSSRPIAHLKIDEERGKYGMWLLILTEGCLFVDLFFSYFYVGNRTHRWMEETAPRLHYVLPMLAILIASSFILHILGERQLKKGNYGMARIGVVITIIFGLAFLVLEGLDFREHWPHTNFMSDSYGSIFNTILGFHAAHVIVGLLMLFYVLFLPFGHVDKTPYRPLHNAALYWHFVDVVWIFVIVILYAYPNA